MNRILISFPACDTFCPDRPRTAPLFFEMLGILRTFSILYSITATIVHIWTVVLAFTEGGFWGGVLSLFLPVLSELYWMITLWESHPDYAILALIHLIAGLPLLLLRAV